MSSPTHLIDQYADLVPDFFNRVLELDSRNYVIDDGSSLYEFHPEAAWEKYASRVLNIYGVDIKNIPSGNLLRVFQRAFPERLKSLVKRKIVDVAQLMLNGEMDLFEGSRNLTWQHNELVGLGEEHDPDFNVFLCVCSDEDQFVFGRERELWDAGALAEVDRKQKEFEEFYSKDDEASCSTLIAKYSEKKPSRITPKLNPHHR